MNKKSWILVGLIVLVFGGILAGVLFAINAGKNGDSAPPKNGEQGKIEKILYGLYDAYNSGDINKAVSYYDVQSQNDKEMLFGVISSVRKTNGPKTIKLISVNQKTAADAVAFVTFSDGTSDDYTLVKKSGKWLLVPFGGGYVSPPTTISPNPTPTPEPTLSPADGKAIKEVVSKFFDAWAKLDIEKMIQYILPSERKAYKDLFQNVISFSIYSSSIDEERSFKIENELVIVKVFVRGRLVTRDEKGLPEENEINQTMEFRFIFANEKWFIKSIY